MRTLALRLIEAEFRSDDATDSEGRAAFRVLEKLRIPLSTLTGPAGFHSLFSRARSLAKTEAPWLSELQMKPHGPLIFTPEQEAALHSAPAVEGGRALLTQLLALLETFIGEALTLRLVQNIWPSVTLKNTKTGDQS